MLKKYPWIVAIGLLGFLNPVWADSISGSPEVDFHKGTLEIPCVLVKNLEDFPEGKYFDVVLDQRGKSMNWELGFTQSEDPEFCQDIADYAEGMDEDYEEVIEEDLEEEVEE